MTKEQRHARNDVVNLLRIAQKICHQSKLDDLGAEIQAVLDEVLQEAKADLVESMNRVLP